MWTADYLLHTPCVVVTSMRQRKLLLSRKQKQKEEAHKECVK